MVDSYTTVFNAANTNYDFANYAFSNWLDFHNGVLDFDKNDHWGNSSILDRAINESARAFNAKNKAFYNFNWNYYNEDYRKEHYKSIESELNSLNDFYKDWYDDHLKKCKDLQNKIQIEKDLQDRMRTYKGMFMPAVEMGIKLYQTQNRATDVQNNEHEVPNVFDCIQKGDYKRFLRSFEGGVDLSVCNADGYNPLTLAVQTGNNMMVQFMLDHLADPAIKDRRGYNAFHTAVENQYRDICKMLLDVDPDLINTKTSAGISIAALAKKQTFMKWIEQEIDNAL